MKVFLALLHARNLEFVRDRGAFGWSIAFPLLIVFGFAAAFSDNEETLFTVGILGNGLDENLSENAPTTALLQLPSISSRSWTDQEQAVAALRRHKIDLLIAGGQRQYWVNSSSSNGQFLEQLLLQEMHGDGDPDISLQWQKQSIDGPVIRYVDWVIPGVLGMNMMFAALFGVGYVIVRYRNNGVLKRLQATPVTPVQFLSAQVVSRLFIIISISSVIYIGCDYFLDFVMLGSHSLLLLVGLLGGMAMIALGLVVASRTASEEFAGGLLNMCTWPMMFFSGIWFPLDDAPQWMTGIASIMPLTHMVSAGRAIMLDGAGIVEIYPQLLILCGMTGILVLLAARLFRWHY